MPGEIDGLLRTGAARLRDAQNRDNSPESRFDLGYNAAHAFALAALRWHGYRAGNRYLVFQALAHTLAMPPPTLRILAKAHQLRNRTEYEGLAEVDETLLENLTELAGELLVKCRALTSG